MTEIGHLYQLRHWCQNSPNILALVTCTIQYSLYNYVTDAKMSHFERAKYLGYFGIGDVIDTRDLSLSQPFRAILATIAYDHTDTDQNTGNLRDTTILILYCSTRSVKFPVKCWYLHRTDIIRIGIVKLIFEITRQKLWNYFHFTWDALKLTWF